MRLHVLIGLLALATGLVVLDTPVAAAEPQVNASVATFIRGDIRGVVYARAAGPDEVEVRFGLHLLEPGETYFVAGMPSSCPSLLAPGFGAWSVRVEGGDGSVVGRARVPREGDLSRTASTMVFQLVGPGAYEGVACTPGAIGHVTPPPVDPPANASVATWVRGPLRGVAYARAFGEVGADVRFSLTGMQPSTTHLLAGSRRPCNRPARDSQSVWVVDFDSDVNGERVFRHLRTERFGTFAQVRSTRLYVLEEPGQFGVQVSCVPGAVGRMRPPA